MKNGETHWNKQATGLYEEKKKKIKFSASSWLILINKKKRERDLYV